MDKRKDYLPFGKPNFSDEEIEAVTRVMRAGWVGMGKETIAFEEELAKAVESPYVVTVSSCTAALFLSLKALGVGAGDEVICPSLTWCSTANASIYLGAAPAFCDVDKDTLSVSTDSILSLVTEKTKAVTLVHFGGYAFCVDELREKLPDHVAIVEDAAHAIGARFSDGSTVGSSENMTCFSFYANKNLSTGEGGAVALKDEEMADRLRSLRQHGLATNAWKRFNSPRRLLADSIAELGYKMNYTDLQASIGRVQLKRLPEFHERRLEIANRYVKSFEGTDLIFQKGATDDFHARHLLTVLLPVERLGMTRDEVVLKLRDENVGASVHYDPLHQMPLYEKYKRGDMSVTEDVAKRVMTLPISASMSDEDVDYVIDRLSRIL